MLRMNRYLCAFALYAAAAAAVAAVAVPPSMKPDSEALDRSAAATKAPVATKAPAGVRAVTSPAVSAAAAATAAAAECNGTDMASFASTQSRSRYELYREHYTGCRVVRGDLVLTKLSDPTAAYNLSFLSDIEEIGGYLLIQGVLADEIPLTSLRTIKGRRLYRNFYAVYVENNFWSSGGRGLRELQMPKLKSIDRGDVKIGRNPNLCFMENIEWGQLMKEQTSTLDKTNKPGDLATSDRCGFCHSNCAKHCWGRGPNMCQDRSTLFLLRGDRQVKPACKGNARQGNCADGVDAAGASQSPAASGATADSGRPARPCSATGVNRPLCNPQQQQMRSRPRRRTTTSATLAATQSSVGSMTTSTAAAANGPTASDTPPASSAHVSGSTSVE